MTQMLRGPAVRLARRVEQKWPREKPISKEGWVRAACIGGAYGMYLDSLSLSPPPSPSHSLSEILLDARETAVSEIKIFNPEHAELFADRFLRANV